MQQSFNMEQTSFATENLKNTVTTVNAMKQANKQLKKQYKKVNIDKIEVSAIFIIINTYKIQKSQY